MFILFSATDGTAGPELWRTNGTTAGTRPVWRAPGRSSGRTILDLAASRSHLFFSAATGVDAGGRRVDSEPHAILLERPWR